MIDKREAINMVKSLVGYDSSNPFESRTFSAELVTKIGRTYRDVEVIVGRLGSREIANYYVDRETGEIEEA